MIAGPIAAIILTGIPGLVAWGTMKAQVKVQGEQLHEVTLQVAAKADRADVESLREDIRSLGDRVNQRLDRLLERVGGRKTD